MGKKPTVKLRVYKGKQMNYDQNGKVQNENQKVVLTHDTKQWKNYLASLRANGFIKVDVENVSIVDSIKQDNGHFEDKVTPATDELINQIKEEVKVAFEPPKQDLTDDQKRIKALEEKIERLTSGANKPVKELEVKGAEEITGDDISDLRDEYKELYGKNAFNGWDADKIKEKIAEKKAS